LKAQIDNEFKNDFYSIPDWVEDVDDLVEYLNLSFDEGNILKSLWGNLGTDKLKAANKCLHYAQRRQKRILKDAKEKESSFSNIIK